MPARCARSSSGWPPLSGRVLKFGPFLVVEDRAWGRTRHEEYRRISIVAGGSRRRSSAARNVANFRTRPLVARDEEEVDELAERGHEGGDVGQGCGVEH